jgi:integrase
MGDSSNSRRLGKSTIYRKPSKDFPLSIHKGTGYWCKKVRGRVRYFGSIASDPKGRAALEEWLRVKDDLMAGREPRPKLDGELTVADLCNEFVAHKELLRDNGELAVRTFRGYYDTCARVVDAFGRNRSIADLLPEDFRKLRVSLAVNRGAVSLRNEMQRVRSVFKFAFDEGLVLTPIRFGQGFTKPKLDTIRREREEHRNKHGDRMFEAAEIRNILTESKQPLRAMILLAANGGLGQSDLATMPIRSVDVDAGWLDFARAKTAVRRKIPLWPETVESIQHWLTHFRREAKDSSDSELLFLTVRGAPWVKVSAKGAPKDAIAQEFNKTLRKLKLKRPGVSFYALRHTFATIGGETADQIAVDAIMGHVPQGMGATYRERISEERLRNVVDHVRRWIFEAGAES